MPNQTSYPYALDLIRRCLEAIAKLDERLAACQKDAERYVAAEKNSLDALNTRNAYLAGGLPVIIGEAVDLAQRALAQLPAAAGIETTGYSSDSIRWPEYRYEIPGTVALECPQCGTLHQCDVLLGENYNGYQQAHASIDTDPCSGCHKRLCPSCPGATGGTDRYCTDCAREARLCRCGHPRRDHAKTVGQSGGSEQERLACLSCDWQECEDYQEKQETHRAP